MREARLKNREKFLRIERAAKTRFRQRLGEDGWRRKQKEYNLTRYGLTLNNYEQMLKDQNNSCAICGGPPSTKGVFHVDHDHVTNIVRGLLCAACNQGMKALDRVPDWCEKAAKYAAKIRSA